MVLALGPLEIHLRHLRQLCCESSAVACRNSQEAVEARKCIRPSPGTANRSGLIHPVCRRAGQRRVSEKAATHDARTRGQPCHPELSLPPLLFSTSSSVTLQKRAPPLLCELLASAPLRTTSDSVVRCDGWLSLRKKTCCTKPRACLHAFGPTHFLTTSRTKVVLSLLLSS